jgi:hypothetical protein
MFIVEDGTAVDKANSYVTVQEFRDYWSDRGVEFTTKTDEEIESSLVIATQYIDINFRYIGRKSTNNQKLQWPRTYAYNPEGYVYSGIPDEIISATCEAGNFALIGENLFATAEKGVTSKTENVGPVQTTYQYRSQQTGIVIYQSVNMYLKDLIQKRTNRVRRY